MSRRRVCRCGAVLMQDLTQGRADAKEAQEAREALQAVERELSRTRAVFFVTQEQVGGRCVQGTALGCCHHAAAADGYQHTRDGRSLAGTTQSRSVDASAQVRRVVYGQKCHTL